MARASVAARAAARQALALHAYDDALTFGAMAAETASTPAERREAHELRGDALRRLDREAEAAAAYAHARLAGAVGGSSGTASPIVDDDAVRLRRKELRSALRAGTVSVATVTAEARKLLEGAETLPAVRRCALELLLAEALVEGNEHEEAIETARRAETAAREAGDTGQIADAMLVLGAALLRAARTADADAAATEACVICDSLGEPYVAARAALLKGAVAVSRHDHPAARSAYADALRHAERAQVPRLVRQVRERQAEIGN
jgi:tetratricopeptide (TPR) repeat protein